MAKPKRTKAQMLEDYSLIAMYSFRGENQKQIAKFISQQRPYTLTQQTISNDLQALEKIWAEAAAIDINTEKGRLKAHYDYLISECYKAWERSQKDAVTITKGSTPKGEISTIQTQGQAGDGKYLSEIRALLAEYADLFGLHAPKAIKHEGEIEVVEQSMSPEQIAQKVVILMELARKRKKDAGQ